MEGLEEDGNDAAGRPIGQSDTVTAARGGKDTAPVAGARAWNQPAAADAATESASSPPPAAANEPPAAEDVQEPASAAPSASTQVHAVSEGEHLSAIAVRYDFSDSNTIWRAPANEELRTARPDPHQLVEGDLVAIPEKQVTAYDVATGRRHKFVIRLERLKVRLRILDWSGKPIVGASGTITIGSESRGVTTDGEGVLVTDVPRDCTRGTIEIGGYSYELTIGGLAPASEIRGQVARLTNLGYWRGFDGDLSDPADLRLAIALFQNEHGLDPTGDADEAFTRKLAQVHDEKD